VTRSLMLTARSALAIAAAWTCLLISEDVFRSGADSLVASAEARVGRPLTPVSYAGVARRTTRRAVAAGAAVTGGAYVASGCRQVVNSYGQVVTQCY